MAKLDKITPAFVGPAKHTNTGTVDSTQWSKHWGIHFKITEILYVQFTTCMYYFSPQRALYSCISGSPIKQPN